MVLLLSPVASLPVDSLRTVVDEHEESASSYSFFLPFALELSEASGRILVDRLRASWLSIKAGCPTLSFCLLASSGVCGQWGCVVALLTNWFVRGCRVVRDRPRVHISYPLCPVQHQLAGAGITVEGDVQGQPGQRPSFYW